VGSSYPPERTARLGSSQKNLFLDADCVTTSDYVNEFRVLASSKAFKKEAIAACHTPKGKGNHENIFDVDDDDIQLLLEDHHPHKIVCPQDLT
jgi:hypothetical protein